MSMFLFWSVGIVAGVVFCSFFEWTLHRYVMHRSVVASFFRYPFERHTLVHHHIFKSDHTYHLIHEDDKKTIPMAWWNGPALVAIVLLPFLVLAFIFEKWGILCGAAVPACCILQPMNTCIGACICHGNGMSSVLEFSFGLTATICCIIATCIKISMSSCPWPICSWEH